MVMKAGASNHDKVLIRKLYLQGEHPDVISASLKIRPAQVAAIIKQHQEGTLKIGGTGAGQPLPGDADGQIQTLEPGAAEGILQEQSEAEVKAATDRAEAAEAEAAELRAMMEQMMDGDASETETGEEDPEEDPEEEPDAA